MVLYVAPHSPPTKTANSCPSTRAVTTKKGPNKNIHLQRIKHARYLLKVKIKIKKGCQHLKETERNLNTIVIYWHRNERYEMKATRGNLEQEALKKNK